MLIFSMARLGGNARPRRYTQASPSSRHHFLPALQMQRRGYLVKVWHSHVALLRVVGIFQLAEYV